MCAKQHEFLQSCVEIFAFDLNSLLLKLHVLQSFESIAPLTRQLLSFQQLGDICTKCPPRWMSEESKFTFLVNKNAMTAILNVEKLMGLAVFVLDEVIVLKSGSVTSLTDGFLLLLDVCVQAKSDEAYLVIPFSLLFVFRQLLDFFHELICSFTSRFPKDNQSNLSIFMFHSSWLTITYCSQILYFFKILSNISSTVDLINYTRKCMCSLIDRFSSSSGQVYFGFWEMGTNLAFIHGFLCFRGKNISVNVCNFWLSKLLWEFEVVIHFAKNSESLFFLFRS